MSQHEDFAESLAGYALDALDATERRAFEAHLATCAQCQTDLVELRRVGAALGAGVEPIAPPPALRARVLAAATSQPQAPLALHADAPAPFRRRNQTVVAMPLPGQSPRQDVVVKKTILPMAASVLIAAGLGWYAWQLRGEVLSLRQEVGQLSARAESLRTELITVRRDAARLSHTASVLSAPVLLKADLKGDPKLMPNATGRAFISPERGLVFNADHLSPLSSGQMYQLWVIPPGGAKPVAAGVIQLDASGTNGTASGPLPAGVTSVQAVAVSIETTPNPPQPSTSVVLLGTPVASSR